MPPGEVLANASAHSPSITSAQLQLAQLGYDENGPITGTMNAPTVQAVKAFQAAHHLAVTGQLDAPTRQAIQLAAANA